MNPARTRACAGLVAAVLAIPVSAHHLDGYWKSEHGGISLEVVGHTVQVYETTRSYRIPRELFGFQQDHSFNAGAGLVYRFERDGQHLAILDQNGEVYLPFRSVAGLPPEAPASQDPVLVFDVLWESFEENFALFDLTGTDWQALRDEFRPQARQAMSNDQLFDLLGRMLDPLNDRHTTLLRTDTLERYQSGPAPDAFWSGRENVFLNNVATAYIGTPLQSRFADPRMRFGILPGNVGYLAVSNFLDLTFGPEFETTLDAVLQQLEDTVGLVVDLRFNPGGTLPNTLEFLQRLLGPGTDFVWALDIRRSAPQPMTFTELRVQGIAPLGNPFYRRPVVILTAQFTASGGETATLATLEQPRFVQVGETTRGVFSSLLFRTLPNGWQATLSNQRYYSLGGVSYEQKGIPPMVAVDRADYDLGQGVDAALDAALDVVAMQPPAVDTPFDVAAAASAVWYDSGRAGEGWHIQRVGPDAVFVTLYTFDPSDPDVQRWVVGLGRVEDGVIVVERLVTTEGGVFGAGPGDPQMIEESDWGRARIAFEDCDRAVAEVVGPDAFRGFVFRLERLSALPGVGCAGPGDGLLQSSALSGAWLVAGRPGEGWLVSHTSPGTAVVTWYTFDAEGDPLWLIGVGTVEAGGRLVVPELFRARGTRYGYAFEPGAVELDPVGALEIEAQACNSATIRFSPVEPSANEHVFEVERLLFLEGVDYGAACP